MSYDNSRPRWAEAIRQGDWSGAEEALSDAAIQRYSVAQIQPRCAQITEDAGAYGKYCANLAEEKVRKDYQQGLLRSAEDVVTAYEHHLNTEIQQFRQDVRPGHMRSTTEPFLPADAEVRDYIQERRARQQELRDEGRRIATITPGPGK
jgi:hypothetical protein